MQNYGLIPVRNFGRITETVFRSAQPIYGYEYKWLEKEVGITHIVSLREESEHDEKIHSIGLGGNITMIRIAVKDHHCPTNEQAEAFKTVILSMKQGDKLLIHCKHGRGRTSTFSVLTKVFSGTSLDEAIEDEKQRFHYHFQHKEQENWLHTFVKGGNE